MGSVPRQSTGTSEPSDEARPRSVPCMAARNDAVRSPGRRLWVHSEFRRHGNGFGHCLHRRQVARRLTAPPGISAGLRRSCAFATRSLTRDPRRSCRYGAVEKR
jgi:hypothetical protein